MRRASVSVAVLRSRLAAILQDVERGEEILTTRSGRPVAKLVPVADPDARLRAAGVRGAEALGPHSESEAGPPLARRFADEDRARGTGYIRFWGHERTRKALQLDGGGPSRCGPAASRSEGEGSASRRRRPRRPFSDQVCLWRSNGVAIVSTRWLLQRR
jgi:prevent-host-death family protein